MEATKPTIEERLAKLHAEMDAIIDQFIDERFAVCPGVPRETVFCPGVHLMYSSQFKGRRVEVEVAVGLSPTTILTPSLVRFAHQRPCFAQMHLHFH
jgi:hypothetical protein